MVHEVRLRTGIEAILQRPINDAEFTRFDAIYAATSGSLDERLNASFNTIADDATAANVQNVVSYYQVFYGRQPDPAGLNFWTDQLTSGAETLNSLAEKFAAASEYNERFGDQQPVEVVATLYANVLGRAPDAAGLTFWASQVADGSLSLADLGRFFATSDEAQARFDPFVDALLVDAANGTPSFDDTQSLFAVSTDNGVVVDASAPIALTGQTGAVNGGGGNDTFQAESGDVVSGSNINGGAGADVLEVFNETQGIAVSPRMTGVETVAWTEQTNDLNSQADNNVGGYSNGNSVEVDVELDAGRISGVTRWEDYDSRADLVIEDARDDDAIDGTFTGGIEVAMVSTDPGNVDYAIYFDQPVNLPPVNTSTVSLEVLDLDTADTINENAVDGDTTGVLNDATLSQFTIRFNDVPVTIVLFDREAAIDGSTPAPAGVVGEGATYNTLIAAIQTAIDANPALAGQGIVASLGDTFDETASPQNDVGGGSSIFGRQVQLTAPAGNTLEAVSRVAFSDDPSRAIAARITDEVETANQDLISVNVDLDDVGKGSMGGDLVIGAMSTGRQDGDDRTSDSQGIEQFDIEVDRSSQLQTINSTNNSLEVVTIANGANNGPNGTTGASDQLVGDLVVRGRANPNENIATDGAMPGAAEQHDDFGFNDVRQINASTMVGDVDLTLNLGDDIIAKYFDLDDNGSSGNADDIAFDYDLGTGNDEFLVNLSSAALVDTGTASREDLNLTVGGNAGNDSIVVNVGTAEKFIDGQGQDFYELTALNDTDEDGTVLDNGWYANQAQNDGASISVNGDAGNDSIWTHGWGDARINAGDGSDVVYTDNEGADILPAFLNNISRNLDDTAQQIDYEVGAVWTFNDDNGDDNETGFGGQGDVDDIAGSTNTNIAVLPANSARIGGTSYEARVSVSFLGAGGDDDTAYTSTLTIANSALDANGQITEQELNQVIKRAINSDDVLSDLLEAVDGPGQSMVVYSKIDGNFSTEDLQISINDVRTTGGVESVTPVSLAGTAYDTSVAGASDGTDFQNLGRASRAESDNLIFIDADGDDDVTVLSTSDGDGEDGGPNINGVSNEILRFEDSTSSFGTETVFNFDAVDDDGGTDDGNAEDRDWFEFTTVDYSRTAADFGDGSFNTADNSISVVELDPADTNDSAGKVADFYDGAATTGNPTTDHIAIVYDDGVNNTGRVYLVTDTVGGTAEARVLGNIELIGTDWDSLEFDNFL